MQLHQIQRKTDRARSVRIGRGGKRGKTSGRGGKGQTARAGGRPRPEMRDIIKRLPKLRGHGKNRAHGVNEERVRPVVVNLNTLQVAFPEGGEISPKVLVASGVVHTLGGVMPLVKILGNGEVTTRFTVRGCLLSASARKKIEGAGGTCA